MSMRSPSYHICTVVLLYVVRCTLYVLNNKKIYTVKWRMKKLEVEVISYCTVCCMLSDVVGCRLWYRWHIHTRPHTVSYSIWYIIYHTVLPGTCHFEMKDQTTSFPALACSLRFRDCFRFHLRFLRFPLLCSALPFRGRVSGLGCQFGFALLGHWGR